MRPFALLLLLCVLPSAPQNGAMAQRTTAPTMTVKVFFGNEKRNPNSDPCSLVFPATRVVPKTGGVARAALEQLFMGPTEKEKADGFHSWFKPESKSILKNINVKNRTAYVNLRAETFSILSGNVSTSCGSSQFLSEMEATLLQFPSIKKVFFAIDGKPEDFYEFLQGECPQELQRGTKCDGSNFK